MANVSTQFIDPADTYGVYTSDVVQPTKWQHRSNQTRGVFQVDWTSGVLSLQMRVHEDAPWLTINTYGADTIEEIVLGNFMRVVSTGAAKAWLGEVE